MITFPHAKINLGLNVTEKRSDGYHNLETVFYPVQWCDVMEILPGEDYTSGIEVHASGLPVAGKHADHLCVKAYALLKKNYPVRAVKLFLHKQIPMGAGLGGGSSDAAACVKMINEMFALGISTSDMQELVKQLGADCPFFIEGKPVYATARGDEFEPVRVLLKDHFVYIVHPGIHVSTAEAFSRVVPLKPAMNVKEIVENNPVSEWKNLLQNDFESSVFAIHPAIETVKKKLYEAGALYASMSGSGSAVYGIFEKEPEELAIFSNMKSWKGKL
ncbi:MAG TPA: 4-(cytidine 5'-diphospho)-2-C-methyl-D-erythritol kinase [Bacteroidia bacterium]|nr:4-(cytidine 5'-diphospho)-2-C-methyl-D-erythritol kinase [Bacteroidia bacterium]